MQQKIEIVLQYINALPKSDNIKDLIKEVVLRSLDLNNPEAMKGISEFAANNADLHEIVAQTIGIKLFNEGKYSEATNWLFEVRGGWLVNRMGKKLIDIIFKKGLAELKKVFDIKKIEPKVLDSPGKISFIADYINFKNLSSGEEIPLDPNSAAALFMQMIKSNSCPPEYIGELLFEAIPILQNENARYAFNCQNLEILMQTLTQFELSLETGIGYICLKTLIGTIAKRCREKVEAIRKSLLDSYQKAVFSE